MTMASVTPVDHNGAYVGTNSNGYNSTPSDGGKSPLSMSLGFLKSLTEKKTTRGTSGQISVANSHSNIQ
jgi:hypothetical protein